MENELGNVLYVDDEVNNLIAFKASFRKYFNIYTANTAKEGIEILRSQKIEVIITDQKMPQMTGIQLLEAIMPEFPDIIRVILTGFTDIEAIISAINTARVFRYVQKPWDKAELKKLLDQAINTYRLDKDSRELFKNLRIELSNKEHLITTLKEYAPPDILDQALKLTKEKSVSPVIQKRIVTVFFSKISNFNQVIDQLSTDSLATFLNSYYTFILKIIEKHKGYVSKFSGDCFIAVFDTSNSYHENAYNAVNSGIEMLKKLEDIHLVNTEKKIEIKINIGIDTGETIIGNISTHDFIAIGETVLHAQKITEISTNLSNTILLSQSSYHEVKNKFEIEALEENLIDSAKKEVIYKVVAKKT